MTDACSSTMTVQCPACGGGDVQVEPRQVPGSVKGNVGSFWEEVSVCEGCGAEFYTHEQSLASSRAYAAAKRKSQSLLSGEEIKAARLALGYSQAEFESALGVGKKTVGRWERGTVTPGPAANGLLWVALKHPAVFQDYARSRLPSSVRGGHSGAPVIARISQAPTENSPAVVTRYRAFDGVGASTGEHMVMNTETALGSLASSKAGST